MIKIAPSILGVDNPTSYINLMLEHQIEWIHYDVMDNQFVKAWSLPIEEVDQIIQTTKNHIIDIHLMVQDPELYISHFYQSVDYITFHVEACDKAQITYLLNKYKGKAKFGLAINPDTPIERVKPFIKKISFVLVMSVWPGRGGQTFMAETMTKVELLTKLGVQVHIDGGINDQTAKAAIEAGASLLVSGSYLFKSENKAEAIKSLLK